MTPTATPDPGGRPSALRWILPLVAVLVALVVGLIALTRSGSDGGGGSGGATTTTTEPAPVAVTSDAPAYATLDDLARASTAVVRGKVSSTEVGRTFGGGADGTSITSRLVHLDVEEVLRGSGVEAGASLLVEEEGWTADGAPLIVDGVEPSAAGDEGIWFLVDTGDATTGSWITVNAQGRYLVGADGQVTGRAVDDPLVAELTAGSIDDLAGRISRIQPGP